MENLVLDRAAPDRQGVALKAFARIADAWSLTLRESAAKAHGAEEARRLLIEAGRTAVLELHG